jgi:long-chain acyl-CoA synthetase
LAALPEKVSDLIAPWADRCPNQIALAEASGTSSFKELDSMVATTRARLMDCGVRPGDRVVLVFENCRAFVVLFMALAAIDAWPVLVNARLSENELRNIELHCQPRLAIFTSAASLHAAAHAARQKAVVQNLADLGTIAVGALNSHSDPEPLDSDPAQRIAALIYTSGTTGTPKGVMLTHRNLLFIAAISAKVRSVTQTDRVLGVLPMSHAVGLSVVLLGSLFSGAMVYLLPNFDPMTVRDLLQRQKFTLLLGVPAMFAQFIEYSRLRKVNSLYFPDLRIVASSGAPLSLELKTAVEQLFGLVLYNGYGVTEASPTIATTPVECPRNDTSVGSPLPGVEIRLVGAAGETVQPGEVGELRVKGPNVMKGYYRAPQETSAVIDEHGWFNTRDLAKLVDNSLFIVGRTKDLIVHLGFNVYPAEVEAVLNSFPGVVRSAVIGHAVEATGDELVIAFVQLQPDSSVSVRELAQHAAKHLAPYKVPSEIHHVIDMPLTPTGKVIKERLRRGLLDQRGLNTTESKAES